MLELTNVRRTFGGLVALDDFNLTVKKGEILGLIGPNGSGKTTSFNIISGMLKPDSGRIVFNGDDITGLKPNRVCHQGIARTFQLTKPFTQMTAIQNVMVGRMYGRKSKDSMALAEKDCRRLLDFVGLGGKEEAPSGNFGVVERKRLEIARALATDPHMLLLDEMMSGLTHSEMEEAVALVQAISESGITLIVVEHVMNIIKRISSHLVVLSYGVKIAEGEPEAVLKDPKVVEAYLGD